MNRITSYALATLLFLGFHVAIAEEAGPLEILAAAVAFIQTPKPQVVQVDGKSFEVYLKPIEGGSPTRQLQFETGTGFFVANDEMLFLVTAKHVAVATSKETTLTIRVENDEPMSFPISKLTGRDELPRWTMHDKADVAVLRLNPVADLLPRLQKHFLHVNSLQSELAAPERTRSLTTLGFPMGLGVTEKFSPISRDAHAASGLLSLSALNRNDPGTYFLLDSPSIGGFSGSPVCIMPGAYVSGASLVFATGGGPQCIGLVSGTISDNTGGKMAAIVPSAFILETLTKAK
jgi:hypothetical protein